MREIFRLVREKGDSKPEWLVYENVKGMLSSNRGFDFLAICVEMGELGYDIEWQMFNSKYHAVPQNRERIYLIGHLRAAGERKIFPLVGADAEDSNDVKQIGRQKSHRDNPNQYRIYDKDGCGACLSTMGGGGLEPHTAIPMFGIDYNVNGKERNTANTLTCRNNVNGITKIQQDGTVVCMPVLTPDRPNKKQNGRRMKENGEDAFTLTSQDRHGVALKVKKATIKGYAEASYGDSINISMPESKTRRGRVGKQVANTFDCKCEQAIPVIWYDKYKCYIAIRKLTPRECFRLQGWEDEYFDRAQFVNSDSQLYKQAGNGVTVNVVYDIARAMGV